MYRYAPKCILNQINIRESIIIEAIIDLMTGPAATNLRTKYS